MKMILKSKPRVAACLVDLLKILHQFILTVSIKYGLIRKQLFKLTLIEVQELIDAVSAALKSPDIVIDGVARNAQSGPYLSIAEAVLVQDQNLSYIHRIKCVCHSLSFNIKRTSLLELSKWHKSNRKSSRLL